MWFPRKKRENPVTGQWKIIRLELARTPEYPEGSPSRAYILRLPLSKDGLIDEAMVGSHPELASVLRSLPEEPDQKGYIVRKASGWAFSYALGDDDDEAVYHLETHPIRMGDYITLAEPDGQRLPFRVVQLSADSVAD